jgi:hypothetical protein
MLGHQMSQPKEFTPFLKFIFRNLEQVKINMKELLQLTF